MVLQCVSIPSIDHLTLYCKACPGKITLKSDYLPVGALEVVPKIPDSDTFPRLQHTTAPHTTGCVAKTGLPKVQGGIPDC